MLNAETARKRAQDWLDVQHQCFRSARDQGALFASALLQVQAETLERAAALGTEQICRAIRQTRAALKKLEAPNAQR